MRLTPVNRSTAARNAATYGRTAQSRTSGAEISAREELRMAVRIALRHTLRQRRHHRHAEHDGEGDDANDHPRPWPGSATARRSHYPPPFRRRSPARRPRPTPRPLPASHRLCDGQCRMKFLHLAPRSFRRRVTGRVPGLGTMPLLRGAMFDGQCCSWMQFSPGLGRESRKPRPLPERGRMSPAFPSRSCFQRIVNLPDRSVCHRHEADRKCRRARWGQRPGHRSTATELRTPG